MIFFENSQQLDQNLMKRGKMIFYLIRLYEELVVLEYLLVGRQRILHPLQAEGFHLLQLKYVVEVLNSQLSHLKVEYEMQQASFFG